MTGWRTTRSETQQRSELLVCVCSHLRFLINHQKSELTSTQVFNLHLQMVFLEEKNLSEVMAKAESLNHIYQASAPQWLFLIVMFQIQASFIPLCQWESQTHSVSPKLSLEPKQGLYLTVGSNDSRNQTPSPMVVISTDPN